MSNGFPSIDKQIPPTPRVVYLDSGLAIFSVPSNPEGIVSAAPGSLAIDSTGKWFRKQTGGAGPTGWNEDIGAGLPAGVPIALPSNFTPTPNAGGNVETTLRTRNLGNTIAANGDWIRITYGGTLTSTGMLRLTVGAGNFLIFGPVASSASWRIVEEIGLVNASTGLIQVSIQFIDGTNTYYTVGNAQGVVNLVNWGTNLFGNGPNAGDAICNMMMIELFKL